MQQFFPLLLEVAEIVRGAARVALLARIALFELDLHQRVAQLRRLARGQAVGRPIALDVRDRAERPDIALVLVQDRPLLNIVYRWVTITISRKKSCKIACIIQV